MTTTTRADLVAAAVLDGKSETEHAAAVKAARARANAGKIAAWYRENMPGGPVKPLPTIAHQNSKLRDTDKIAFLIWNTPAMITCPGATAACMGACYARAAERFVNVRRSRLENLKWSRQTDFVDRMAESITRTLYTARGKMRRPFVGKQVIFRVHESGDYYSAEYMRAWFEIARRFPGIRFFSYTKSFDIFAACAVDMPENFTIRASIWSDTDRARVDYIAAAGLPYYTAVPAADLDRTLTATGGTACDCGDGCGACGCMCAARAALDVFAAIH